MTQLPAPHRNASRLLYNEIDLQAKQLGEFAERSAADIEHLRAERDALRADNERLRIAIGDALPWLETAAPMLNTSAPWEHLRNALTTKENPDG